MASYVPKTRAQVMGGTGSGLQLFCTLQRSPQQALVVLASGISRSTPRHVDDHQC